MNAPLNLTTDMANALRALAMDAVQKAKPSAAKGKYIKSIFMASTMGPSVSVTPSVLEK